MGSASAQEPAGPPPSVRLMTLDPGHFHAALVQKEMYPGVSPRVDVYGPLGPDLVAHLGRIAGFNTRSHRPTRWEAEVHAAPDFFERMAREPPGNVVVLAGRNRSKIEYIVRSIGLGLHVLADKPWIVRSADLPLLEEALDGADAAGLVAYDIMTERYEITNMLHRELVNDSAIVGRVISGSREEPAVYIRSVHHILKTVAGAPLKRPSWFFDPREQGEPLADVGTHLVDLAIWTLFPNTAPEVERDVRLLSGTTWPTKLSREQFQRVTGEQEFPEMLREWVEGSTLLCPFNQQIVFSLGGIHVKLDVLWDAESEHGDTHDAIYRGDRASVSVRQGAAESWVPEVYVTPSGESDPAPVVAAVRERISRLQGRWPGLEVVEKGSEVLITIPDRYRVGHEHHFSEVAELFLEYLRDPRSLPAWERATLLAKYHITTHGTDLSRNRSARPGS